MRGGNESGGKLDYTVELRDLIGQIPSYVSSLYLAVVPSLCPGIESPPQKQGHSQRH